MRLQLSADEEACAFSKQLLNVGNGTLISEQEGRVSLPLGHMLSDLKEQILTRVFPNMRNQFSDPK